ncbi:flagellar biosynthesis protein FlhF [Litchfieldella rifensis]|uniref:Flagellar biosynthesis protein FlhF n=1 Tax=Litchfieldella rifensis TaxID=762643 RepID=A0ABV7LTF9_9GAMM
MSVKRFVGANSREAMRQVRAALGDDALILSNRRVEAGVEVLAMADDEHGRLTETRTAPATTPAPRSSASAERVERTREVRSQSPQATTIPDVAPVQATPMDFAALSERLLGEMQDMRALLNRQGTPAPATSAADVTTRLCQRLAAAGVGPRLAAELLATRPSELEMAESSDTSLQAWLVRQLVARLAVPADETDLLDAGGIIALVGPTGVGKTTTTAKLAARYVMRHGSDRVALVTTDSYRVGAHEQLRIYARLLGVEVHALEAEAPLPALLERLADKRLVIIDTVGMSQRDQRLVKQVAQLGSGGGAVRLMLLLNAASHGDTLEEVIATYRRAAEAAGNRLVDCILTKSDEAARLGPLLDTVIRHGLRLHYVSHGQQVPEDLALADARQLVEQALMVDGDSPFAPDAGDLVPVAREVRGMQSLSRGLLGQGRSLTAALASLRQRLPGFALLEAAWDAAFLAQQHQQDVISEMQRQTSRLARERARTDDGLGMLWGPLKVSGCDWASPVQAIDPQGRLLGLSWQHHELPAGQDQRLGWAGDNLGADRHLLAQCPDTAALEWLGAWQLPWLAATKGNRRVTHLGERRSLSQLGELASREAALSCRLHGRHAVVHLACLDIELPGRRGPAAVSVQPATAWFGRLNDVDSGRELGRRYWLSSSLDPALSRRLVSIALALAELPVLVRNAWRHLGDAGLSRSDPALRLSLASGLAAVALRLDQDDTDWAMDVRAQLLSLLVGKGQRKPSQLLEALLHLFAARDVFRQMRHSGQEAL